MKIATSKQLCNVPTVKDFTSVNSHNEWDQLEEVIVGAGIPPELPVLDYTFKLFFHDNIYDKSENYRYSGPNWSPQYFINKQHVEEHKEDIDNFAATLKSLDIIVKRPKVPKKIVKINTPNWESTNHACLNVRDLTIIIGNEIIETPSTCRWRYFETDYMKHLFLEYFKNGARWTKAPSPIMLDSSFDLSYIDRTPGAREYYEELSDRSPNDLDMGFEIMFDAANCMRLGTHIVINSTTKNQDLGVQWLRKHLGPEYTVWDIEICDGHIDSSFVPLRPGLMLLDRPEILDRLPAPLQKWDVIYNPKSCDRLPSYQSNTSMPLASESIDINLLMINPNLAICNSTNIKSLEKLLSPHNIECIPVQMRHDRLFAGGHHCTTLDIRRSSQLENYFA